MHVFFEFGISLSVSSKAFGHGHAPGFATDFETLDQRPIDPNVDLMRLAHADDVKIQLPLQKNFDFILAIEWKVITDGGAAIGPEWQGLTGSLVLDQRCRNLENVG